MKTGGISALYASKQLLRVLCVGKVFVLISGSDTRKVYAYGVRYNDWKRLESWYIERLIPYDPKPREKRPVLALTDEETTTGKLKQFNLRIK